MYTFAHNAMAALQCTLTMHQQVHRQFPFGSWENVAVAEYTGSCSITHPLKSTSTFTLGAVLEPIKRVRTVPHNAVPQERENYKGLR